MKRAARTPPDQQTMRLASLLSLPGVLEERGVDAGGLLKEFGLTPASFMDPDNRMPDTTVARLLNRCASASKCPWFGLLIGQHMGLSSLGALGFLMQSASDVRTALTLGTLHHRAQAQGATVWVEEKPGFVSFCHAILTPDVPGTDHRTDAALATIVNIMRGLCGPAWRPLLVTFAHRQPAELRQFKQYFGPALQFDSERSSVVFASKWMEAPIPTADLVLRRLMEQRLEELQTRTPIDLPSLLQRHLRAWVLEQDHSIDRAARYLGVTVRTLNRRLAVHGATFSVIRDQARRDVACGMLRNTKMHVLEIASLLSYSDASAFTHAFVRWTGITPSTWRTRQAMQRPRIRKALSRGAPDLVARRRVLQNS